MAIFYGEIPRIRFQNGNFPCSVSFFARPACTVGLLMLVYEIQVKRFMSHMFTIASAARRDPALSSRNSTYLWLAAHKKNEALWGSRAKDAFASTTTGAAERLRDSSPPTPLPTHTILPSLRAQVSFLPRRGGSFSMHATPQALRVSSTSFLFCKPLHPWYPPPSHLSKCPLRLLPNRGH